MPQSFHHARSFDEGYRQADFAGRSARPTACSSWPIANTLRSTCEALREALAAHRQYEHLKRSGIPHDMAIRLALGVSHSGKSSPHCASRSQSDHRPDAGRPTGDRSPQYHHESTRDASQP